MYLASTLKSNQKLLEKMSIDEKAFRNRKIQLEKDIELGEIQQKLIESNQELLEKMSIDEVVYIYGFRNRKIQLEKDIELDEIQQKIMEKPAKKAAKEHDTKKAAAVATRMELLNNYIDEDSERLSCWMKLGWMERNKCAWRSFISNTQPRFNVILEIIKNQEKRIQELEKTRIKS